MLLGSIPLCQHSSLPATPSPPWLPPSHLGKAQGGRAPFPRRVVGKGGSRYGSPPRGLWSRELRAGWAAAADGDLWVLCQQAELGTRERFAGGCMHFQCSALHLPALPSAFRAYVSAPSQPPAAPASTTAPGGPGRGQLGRLCSPTACPHRCKSSISCMPALHLIGCLCSQVPPQGLCLLAGHPGLATRPYPGRDGSSGEALPFCPRAPLHAPAQAQRGAELPWNYWSTKKELYADGSGWLWCRLSWAGTP